MLKVVLALFPLVSILFMIFILKKSSIFTGIFACLLTTVIATSPVFHLNIALLPKPFINSFLITLPVTYVLFFGILLYHLMEKSGSIQKIASSIATSTDNRIDQVLLLALGLSPLIESVSGFGLAVIVIAPILMALGFNSLQSSFIALISLCIIPWGTSNGDNYWCIIRKHSFRRFRCWKRSDVHSYLYLLCLLSYIHRRRKRSNAKEKMADTIDGISFRFKRVDL